MPRCIWITVLGEMANNFSTLMKNGEVPLLQRHGGAARSVADDGGLLPSDREDINDGAETFLHNGVNPDILRRLRREKPEGKIDLHGMTIAEAHPALDRFLVAARRRGWRRVEIVHGRGLHSSSGRAVLRGKVRAWLSECDKVLAYAELADNTGAVVAFLAKTGK